MPDYKNRLGSSSSSVWWACKDFVQFFEDDPVKTKGGAAFEKICQIPRWPPDLNTKNSKIVLTSSNVGYMSYETMYR